MLVLCFPVLTITSFAVITINNNANDKATRVRLRFTTSNSKVVNLNAASCESLNCWLGLCSINRMFTSISGPNLCLTHVCLAQLTPHYQEKA